MKSLIVWGMKNNKLAFRTKFETNAAYVISDNWEEFASLPCDAMYLPQSVLYKLIGPERIGLGGLIRIDKETRARLNLPRFIITGMRCTDEQGRRYELMSPFEKSQFFAGDLFMSLRDLSENDDIVFKVWGNFISPTINYFELIHSFNSLLFVVEGDDREKNLQSLKDSAFESFKTDKIAFWDFSIPLTTTNAAVLYHSKDINVRDMFLKAYLRKQESI